MNTENINVATIEYRSRFEVFGDLILKMSEKFKRCLSRSWEVFDYLGDSLVEFDSQIAVRRLFKERPFSDFIRSSAALIKSQVVQRSLEMSNEARKLIVLHLRASDRKCVLKSYGPKQLIDKIKQYGAHSHNTTLYLMTNVDTNSSHKRMLQHYFGRFLFETKDFSLFSQKPFSLSGFLIFATELQLQSISDGFILSYHDHKVYETHKTLGVLSKGICNEWLFGANDTMYLSKNE